MVDGLAGKLTSSLRKPIVNAPAGHPIEMVIAQP